MLKRAIGLAWVSGVAAVVMTAVGAVRAPPPVPEGLSCWYDQEHDLWPTARVIRDDREVRVARRAVHGSFVEVARGRTWFGATLASDGPVRVEFIGDRMVVDGAPYHLASCAVDRNPVLSVVVRDGRFYAGLSGQAPVPVGSFVGPCVDAPHVSDRIERRVLCAQGGLLVSRLTWGIVVVDVSNGTSVTWNVPGVPIVALTEPTSGLSGGDGRPLVLRHTNGEIEDLGVDAPRCVPSAPAGLGVLPIAYDCVLGARTPDAVEHVTMDFSGQGLQVYRMYATRPPNVTFTSLVGT